MSRLRATTDDLDPQDQIHNLRIRLEEERAKVLRQAKQLDWLSRSRIDLRQRSGELMGLLVRILDASVVESGADDPPIQYPNVLVQALLDADEYIEKASGRKEPPGGEAE